MTDGFSGCGEPPRAKESVMDLVGASSWAARWATKKMACSLALVIESGSQCWMLGLVLEGYPIRCDKVPMNRRFEMATSASFAASP